MDVVGRTISHYRLLEKLGEGGMGVVYQAEDTKLERVVALKLLAESLLNDDTARERFLREAKAAAALQHPNICPVYEIGDADGRPFLAMAYLEGETLDRRIERGPLPVDLALDIARQVAEGLQAAHVHGIVHRDIKPANIFVSPDGRATIVDFGLARLAERSALSSPDQQLGTAAYMTPEQAVGADADARSDVWALGVSLYQMLSGTLPFSGDHVARVLYSIVHTEPAPLPESVPERVRALVARLLAKKPKERYRYAAELARDIADLRTGQLQALPPAGAKKGRYWAGAAAAALFLVSGAAFLLLRDSGTSIPVLRTPTPITSLSGREERPAFSPDGRRIAFSWNGPQMDNYDIYVQDIGGGSPQRLTDGPEWDSSPTWSPDGASIAYLHEIGFNRSEIRILPAAGGPERLLAAVRAAARYGLSWSPDGRSLAVPSIDRASGRPILVRVNTETGETNVLAQAPAGAVEARLPTYSPDGATIAFESISGPWLGAVFIVPASGGEPRRLRSTPGFPEGLAWLTGSQALIYSRAAPDGQRSLWFLSLDGEAQELAVDGGGSEPAVSPDGDRLVFAKRLSRYDVVRVALTGDDRQARPFISSTRFDGNPQHSPDGSRIVFSSSRSGAVEIWVCDADGRNARQLTFAGVAGSPHWSPDSTRIAYDAVSEGNSDIFVVDAEGGDPVRITSDSAADYVPTWSRDGKFVYFASDRSGPSRLWKAPADGGGEPELVAMGTALYGIESPEGGFLYFANSRSRETAIWRMSLSTGVTSPVIEGVSSGWANWTVGREGIYYVDDATGADGAQRWGVFYRRFGADESEELAPLADSPTGGAPGFSVSPDGTSALAGQVIIEADLMAAEGDFR